METIEQSIFVWQPMETAPKNSVLLLKSHNLPLIGFWSEEENIWTAAMLMRDLSGYAVHGNASILKPTGWMCLPQADVT